MADTVAAVAGPDPDRAALIRANAALAIVVKRIPTSDTRAGANEAATRIESPNGTYASPVRSAE